MGERGIRLSLTGERVGRGTGFRVNGEPCSLQNGRFVVLLRFAIAHERSRGVWATRHQLGMSREPGDSVAHPRGVRGKVPAGMAVIEADWVGTFRLNPEIVVELDLAELEKPPCRGGCGRS